MSTSSPAADDKDVAVDKEPKNKPIVKAPPSGAKEALHALRPFLRFTDGLKDSDADLPQVGSTRRPSSLPHATSMPRSRSKSKQHKKDRSKSPKRSKTPPRSRSRPVSPTRDRALVVCLASLSLLALPLALILHLSTLPRMLLFQPT